jgi:hypothetical protein
VGKRMFLSRFTAGLDRAIDYDILVGPKILKTNASIPCLQNTFQGFPTLWAVIMQVRKSELSRTIVR